MKRYFCLFLVLIVVFASLPVKSEASSFDPAQEQLGNFFDYSDNYQRHYYITSDHLSINFGLPTEMYISYVELFVYSDVPIDRVVCYGRDAEVIRNGNNYRIIWAVGVTTSNFALNFYFTTSSTGSLHINDASFSSNITSVYVIPCDITGYDMNATSYNYSGNPIDILSSYHGTYDLVNPFSLYFSFDSVKFYDLINISLIFYDLVSIESVTVGSSDTFQFPYDLSFIDNFQSDSRSGSWSHCKLSIDLSDISWSWTNPNISIYIDGFYNYKYIDNNVLPVKYCLIVGIHGFVFSDVGNPVIFWFRKTYVGLGTWFNSLFDKFDDLLSGRSEDQAAADDFQNSVDEQASQFEDMSNTMNQVERPPIESIDLSVNSMVDSNSVILATNGIGTIANNPIILRVILMALTLALAGFVLYGKR